MKVLNCEVEVAVGCISVYMCQKYWVYMPVYHDGCVIFGMWQLFVQWYMSNIFTVLLVEWLMPVISYSGIYMCTHPLYMDVNYLAYMPISTLT